MDKKKYNRIFDEKREEEATEIAMSESEVNETVAPNEFDEKYKGSWKTSRKVNFRKGPSMSEPVITILNQGYPVKCEGYFKNESGKLWLAVSTKHAVGYIMADYLVRR